MPDEPRPVLERTLDVLGSVAGAYPPDSIESAAVREAAEALLFIRLHQNLQASYDRFRANCDRDLPEERREALRSMGIDPDAE